MIVNTLQVRCVLAIALLCLACGGDSGRVAEVHSPAFDLSPETMELQLGSVSSLVVRVRAGEGTHISRSRILWSSSDTAVVTVDGNGQVAARGVGVAEIRAALSGVSARASITVGTVGGAWNRVLERVTISGDVVVPAGERWLIGPNVQIAGNLVTEAGTIAMRPGSSLRFLGAKPDEYVGGGMGYGPGYELDIGIWIGGNGVLDIQGTPKAAWNRTGADPSWKAADEYWVAPTALGDYAPRRWHPEEGVPRISTRAPPAEVMNVTRDIVIEGPAHIHIHSHKPQRIEYVQLRRMGVSNLAHAGAVLGRYALHFHHGGDGTRGTIVRGVAAVESGGRVFVPHESHGITFIDNVSVNSYGEAFWWDEGDTSNDITVDRLAASGVEMPRQVSGRTSREPVVLLPGGQNLTIRNSAVSGAAGSSTSHGFDWGRKNLNDPRIVWTWEGNVAHNNRGIGIRAWWNHNHAHAIVDAVAYRNGWAGIQHGAYRSSTRFNNVLLVEDRWHQNANSQPHEVDGHPSRIQNLRIYQNNGPALVTGKPRQPGRDRMEFVDCFLQPGPGAPKVLIDGPAGPAESAPMPFTILFRRCALTPDDIMAQRPFSSGLSGTNIVIEHEDGRVWEITLDMERQEKVVRRIR